MSMDLKQTRAAALSAAEKIISGAKASNRDLTTDEQALVSGKFAEIDELDKIIARAAKSADLMTQIANLGGPDSGIEDDGRSGLFSDGEKDSFVRAVRSKTAFATTVPFSSHRLKAPMAIGTTLPTTGQTVVAASEPKATFALRDLFTEAPAGGPTVRYYTLGNPDPTTIAIVPEGGLKPETSVAYAPVDASLVKLATRFSITDELAEDAPFLVSEIQRSVVQGVLVRENKLVVDTIAATSGILTATGTAVALLDVLAAAIGSAEALNGQSPTALLLNPTNLATVRTAKASTGGSYFVDPLSNGPTALHGVPLVSTSTVAAGTAYLVTSGFGTFYTRGALRVEAGLTGDDFIYNRTTIRAEERVLPVVNRPSLITKVTLT